MNTNEIKIGAHYSYTNKNHVLGPKTFVARVTAITASRVEYELTNGATLTATPKDFAARYAPVYARTPADC